MNNKMILNLLGHILTVEALFMLPALFISIYLEEKQSTFGFFISILVLSVLGMAVKKVRPHTRAFYAREGFATAALAWLLISVFGALPFYFSGAVPSLLDCMFESVSGFTTTGASILPNVEAMPRGLLYWRSFTHWVGGMGVLVILLAMLPENKGAGHSLHLLRAETPGPWVEKLVPKVRETAAILCVIYIGMTVLQFVLLLAGGMPLFDSITVTFGTAGTGGFAVRNDSVASYSLYLQTVICVFMILFGVSFSTHYLLLKRSFSKLWQNEELWAYLAIILGGTLLVGWNIVPLYEGQVGEALRHALFQVSSIITTTGYATTDYNFWPEFSRGILIALMVIGACSGSTGGGMKVGRILVLLKAFRLNILSMLRPRSVLRARMGGQVLDTRVIESAQAYLSAYAIVVGISVLLLGLDGFSVESNITAVLSCISNVGPGLGQVGPMGTYSDYSWLSKLVLMGNMLIGRLEIFPLLMLATPALWKK